RGWSRMGAGHPRSLLRRGHAAQHGCGGSGARGRVRLRALRLACRAAPGRLARGSARVKIVHVYKDYHPPVRGGIEQTIERMARWQVAAGHEVTVLVSASGQNANRTEVVDGVRVVRVAEVARALSSPLCPGFPAALAAQQADLWHLHSP